MSAVNAAVSATSAVPATMAEALAHWASTRPQDVALRHKQLGIWEEITWEQYFRRVHATASRLWGLGVRPSDHVAILSDNRPEWLYADLGAQAIGARSVGIYQTNPPTDVAYVLKHSAAKLLFCEDQEQLDKAVEVRQQTPDLEHVVVFDPRGTRGYDDPRLITWPAFLSDGLRGVTSDPAWIHRQLQERIPSEPAMVVYTSGTTGQPKGAMLSNVNVMVQAQRTAPRMQLTQNDTLLSYLPLCHVAEKIFTLFLPLQVGAVVHFGESVATVREDLAEVSPTVFLGVPRIWEKMHANIVLRMQDSSWLKRILFGFCRRQGAALAERTGWTLLQRLVWRLGDLLIFRPLQERLGMRRCRLPISGAAPISPDLITWFHSIGIPIREAYGQTECGGVSHTNTPDECRLGTVGRTLPGVQCKLADDGEILVRGPGVFCGYLHDDEATRTVIDKDGWLFTGDLGAIDPDGYLSITGRKKEIIITAGGKNLSPEKIENALKMSSYVKEAIAVGDRRRFIAALVQIDHDAVGDWASRRGIAYTSFEDLAARADVVKLIDSAIEESNELLASVERVRAFRLLRKELHQDDGELTATQKVRRRQINTIHADLIESMYA